MMISTKIIMEMARKWQKQATNKRKRISWRRNIYEENGKAETKAAEKGHFVVYSMDKRRFVVSLVYLNNQIFRELFKLAEEEFRLSTNVPLTLPFDGTVIEYVIMLIQRNVAEDLVDAVLMSIACGRCQSSHPLTPNQHLLLYGF